MMHLYSAGHARPLAASLANVLAELPADPMTSEWLAVPSDGMRRWLMLELASYLGNSGQGSGDGVAANFDRAYPSTLRATVLAAGRDDDDDDPDPWTIDRLVWSVLQTGYDHRDDPKLTPFVQLPPGSSRFAKARRVADLFDRYHLHRPDMIRSWADDVDVDGNLSPIAGHAAWQPHLWRLVRREVGVASPPERLPDLLNRLSNDQLPLDLPPRLLLFGFTLLPGRDFLELARSVAHCRDVHLFLFEPTHLRTGDLLVTAGRSTGGSMLRSVDSSAELIHQPLLRSWGRLHRETAVLLAEAEAAGLPAPQRADIPVDNGSTVTMLQRLQQEIRTNGSSHLPLLSGVGDHSVQFHACFGPIRQVEVLRDALLHLLADHHGDLLEEEILVVCPSLDRFVSLIEGVLGPSAESSAPRVELPEATETNAGVPSLRYRIADQSIRSTNPVFGATTALLDLVAGRFEASTVLDFLSLGPVRQRFRFDDEDLATVAEWVRATNVRWGLNAHVRRSFDVPASIVANTWQAALDQLLVGASVFDDDLMLAMGAVSPHGVEGSDVEVLGSLAEALSHLGTLAFDAATARPITDWIPKIRQACDALFATDRDGSWQLEALHKAFAEMLGSATTEGSSSTVLLEYVDVRRLFEEHLDTMFGRPDFFRGGVTFTSMTPLRWLPYRVIAVLGMDQAAFSSTTPAGDDLMAAAPQLGDPDLRAESRQSLLEAVLAAEETLVIVRDGRDVRTNQPIPRPVVVAELFEAVLSMIEPDQQSNVESSLEIDHPRHSFDERCLTKDGLVSGRSWGLDPASLDGANARRQRSHTRRPFLTTPLAPRETAVIELADLHAYVKNPTGVFLSTRLETRLPWSERQLSSYLPVKLDALEGWDIGTRLLEARLRGATTAQWSKVERVRGTLPPGVLGVETLANVENAVDQLVEAAGRCGVSNRSAVPFEVDVQLADGTRIVGAVPLRLADSTPGPAIISFSSTKPAHRLAAWLDLMALVLSDPNRPWRSIVVARAADKKKEPEVVDLVPIGGPDAACKRAQNALAVVVDCFRRGMNEPIPLFPLVSDDAARGERHRDHWHSDRIRADGDNEAVALAFGQDPLEQVLSIPSRSDDPGTGNGRVERFARYLWDAVADSTCQRQQEPGSGASERSRGEP